MTTETVMAPVHPGEILLEEFLKPLGVIYSRVVWAETQKQAALGETERQRPQRDAVAGFRNMDRRIVFQTITLWMSFARAVKCRG